MADKPSFPKYPTVKVVTPAGVARFPKLLEPDAFKGAAPKFKATIVFDGDTDTSALTEAALKVAEKAFPGRKPEKVNVLIKDGDEAVKKGEGGKEEPIPELQGKTFLNASCSEKFPPVIVGPDRQPLPAGMEVRGGDLVKLQLQALPSDTPIKGTITWRLLAVQLIEKRAGGGGADMDLFSDEGDGFDSKADAEPSKGVDAGAGAEDDDLPF